MRHKESTMETSISNCNQKHTNSANHCLATMQQIVQRHKDTEFIMIENIWYFIRSNSNGTYSSHILFFFLLPPITLHIATKTNNPDFNNVANVKDFVWFLCAVIRFWNNCVHGKLSQFYSSRWIGLLYWFECNFLLENNINSLWKA